TPTSGRRPADIPDDRGSQYRPLTAVAWPPAPSLRCRRLCGIELSVTLFDAASPLVPGNGGADMVGAYYQSGLAAVERIAAWCAKRALLCQRNAVIRKGAGFGQESRRGDQSWTTAKGSTSIRMRSCGSRSSIRVTRAGELGCRCQHDFFHSPLSSFLI